VKSKVKQLEMMVLFCFAFYNATTVRALGIHHSGKEEKLTGCTKGAT